METIRSLWKLPSIGHFCSLFRETFDLPDLDIEDLENAFMASQSDGCSPILVDLICRLLNGYFERKDIVQSNYELYLKDLLKSHYSAEGLPNPLENCAFDDLDIVSKVDLIYDLCDFRLYEEDVEDQLRGVDSDNLRLIPLGWDSEGATYWYFYGTRLYKEVAIAKKIEKKEAKKKRRKEKETHSSTKKSKYDDQSCHLTEIADKNSGKKSRNKKSSEKLKIKVQPEFPYETHKISKSRRNLLEKANSASPLDPLVRRSTRLRKSNTFYGDFDASLPERLYLDDDRDSEVLEKVSRGRESCSKRRHHDNSSKSIKESDNEEDDAQGKDDLSPFKRRPVACADIGLTSGDRDDDEMCDIDPILPSYLHNDDPVDRRKLNDRTGRKAIDATDDNLNHIGNTLRRICPLSHVENEYPDDSSQENCISSCRQSYYPLKLDSPENDESNSFRLKHKIDSDQPSTYCGDKLPNSSLDISNISKSHDEMSNLPSSLQSGMDYQNIDEKPQILDSKNTTDTLVTCSKEHFSDDVNQRDLSNTISDPPTMTNGFIYNKSSNNNVNIDQSNSIPNPNEDITTESRNYTPYSEEKKCQIQEKHEINEILTTITSEIASISNETVKLNDCSLFESCDSSGVKSINHHVQSKPKPQNITPGLEIQDSDEFAAKELLESEASTYLLSTLNSPKIAVDVAEVVSFLLDEIHKIDDSALNENLECFDTKFCSSDSKKDIKPHLISKVHNTESYKQVEINDFVDYRVDLGTDVKAEIKHKAYSSEISDIYFENLNENNGELKDDKMQIRDVPSPSTIIENKYRRKESQSVSNDGDDKMFKVNDKLNMSSAGEESYQSQSKLKTIGCSQLSGVKNCDPDPELNTGWSLVCSTAEEWQALADAFKDSTAKCEKAMYNLIVNSFLPEIPNLLQVKEETTQKKLLEMAPKRISDRLELQRQRQLEQEQMQVELEREEARQRALLEEQRQQILERQRQAEREKRIVERDRIKEERARRLQLREVKAQILADGKEIPPELLYSNSEHKSEMDEDLRSSLLKVCDVVKMHRDSWPFWDPVDTKIAPDYYEVIEKPMDISTIERKLEDNQYDGRGQFVADFKLMFNNCYKYNGRRSKLATMARTLDEQFTTALEKYAPDEDEDDDEDVDYSMYYGQRPKRAAGCRALKFVHDAAETIRKGDIFDTDSEEESNIENKITKYKPVRKKSPVVTSKFIQAASNRPIKQVKVICNTDDISSRYFIVKDPNSDNVSLVSGDGKTKALKLLSRNAILTSPKPDSPQLTNTKLPTSSPLVATTSTQLTRNVPLVTNSNMQPIRHILQNSAFSKFPPGSILVIKKNDSGVTGNAMKILRFPTPATSQSSTNTINLPSSHLSQGDNSQLIQSLPSFEPPTIISTITQSVGTMNPSRLNNLSSPCRTSISPKPSQSMPSTSIMALQRGRPLSQKHFSISASNLANRSPQIVTNTNNNSPSDKPPNILPVYTSPSKINKTIHYKRGSDKAFSWEDDEATAVCDVNISAASTSQNAIPQIAIPGESKVNVILMPLHSYSNAPQETPAHLVNSVSYQDQITQMSDDCRIITPVASCPPSRIPVVQYTMCSSSVSVPTNEVTVSSSSVLPVTNVDVIPSSRVQVLSNSSAAAIKVLIREQPHKVPLMCDNLSVPTLYSLPTHSQSYVQPASLSVLNESCDSPPLLDNEHLTAQVNSVIPIMSAFSDQVPDGDFPPTLNLED